MDSKEKKNQTEQNFFKIKETISLAKKFQEDPLNNDRLKKNHCLVCYYVVKIAMQAFTRSNCDECQSEMVFPNSLIDKFCLKCAQRQNCCSRCGGDI